MFAVSARILRCLRNSIFGAKNWIVIGSLSIQPSEFVKVAYIFAGAAAMDRLFLKRELYVFIIFSAICVILLTLMGDFGTAFVFFSTFLIIAFMRSGSFATVALSIAGAAFASFLAFTFRPYMPSASHLGHVWENVWDKGFQQAKAIACCHRRTFRQGRRAAAKECFCRQHRLSFCHGFGGLYCCPLRLFGDCLLGFSL